MEIQLFHFLFKRSFIYKQFKESFPLELKVTYTDKKKWEK